MAYKKVMKAVAKGAANQARQMAKPRGTALKNLRKSSAGLKKFSKKKGNK